MSQKFQFYKLQVFSEKTTQGFAENNVYESIKALFKGSEHISSEMKEEYFENVQLDSIDITYSEFEKNNPEFDKDLKYLYEPQKIVFFMVDHIIWSGIQEIVDNTIKKKYQKKTQSDTAQRLNEISRISEDYNILLNLFDRKLLFVFIF
ncbi:hypothetical protein ACEYW6_01120 [Nostoc sp. UIC 10607]|uniref:hypothetical protein n=1 Tax=Nostoc sp. UIC 10607 TaxID=3045935 RepID=UPI0039A22BF4